jgi:hypothetical protein
MLRHFGYFHFMAVGAVVFLAGYACEQYFRDVSNRRQHETRRLELEKRPCTP